MHGHLVLVVHGIGEQKPGETVDAVLAGAIAEHRRLRDEVSLDITDETVTLPDHAFADDKPRMPKLFPVHYRRVTKAGETEAPGTVFTEVFWADKSPAPKGLFWTLLGVIRLLLGIGYLAMDNVENKEGWLSYWTVHAFTWLFFGGIAAVNALFLLGVGVLALEGRIFWLEAPGLPQVRDLPGLKPPGVIGAVAFLSAFWAWLVLRRDNQTYMLKMFARGLYVMALMSVIHLALQTFGYWNIDLMRETVPGLPPLLEDYIELILFVMGSLWGLVTSLCVLAYLVWAVEYAGDWWRSRSKAGPDTNGPIPPVLSQSRIYAPICSAMILLWLVLGSAFWLGVKRLVERASVTSNSGHWHDHEPDGLIIGALETYFDPAISAMTVSAICFGVLIVVALGLVIARHIRRETLYRDSEWVLQRLLLSGWLQGVFAISTVLIAGHLFNVFDQNVVGFLCVEHWSRFCQVYITTISYSPIWWVGGVSQSLVELDDYRGVISLALLGLATAFTSFSGAVAGVLGIFRDIVGYATVTRRNGYKHPDPSTYSLRNEIEERFCGVLAAVLDHERPRKLTVISHSQGTVVATRCLGKMLDDPKYPFPDRCRLVTMGSPVTHLYRQYFPRDFDTRFQHFDGECWRVSEDSTRCLDWINIHRADDFVGTRVSYLEHTGKNFVVPAAGHSGYFYDAPVWAILSEKAGLRLP